MGSTPRRGCFITFEGIEGAGKSTQVTALADALRERGYAVLTTFEPGATPLGTHLRTALMHSSGASEPAPLAELLLYLADRAQHLHQTIRPALDRNEVVLCDRFSGSTIAYQGHGRGLRLDLVARLDAAARGGTVPDLTILLECPVEDGLRRATGDDRLQREALEFHRRVRDGFRQLANDDATWVTIASTAPCDAVAQEILDAVLHAGVLPPCPLPRS